MDCGAVHGGRLPFAVLVAGSPIEQDGGVMLFGTWVTTIAGLGYIGVGAITGEAVWSGVPIAVWAFLSLRLLPA